MANKPATVIPGLQQPPPLDFDKTSEWPAWIDHFDDYRFATALNERSGEAQVRTLLYTMGRQAREVFATFELTDDEAKVTMSSSRGSTVISSKSGTLFMKVPAFTDASNDQKSRWISSQPHFTCWQTAATLGI